MSRTVLAIVALTLAVVSVAWICGMMASERQSESGRLSMSRLLLSLRYLEDEVTTRIEHDESRYHKHDDSDPVVHPLTDESAHKVLNRPRHWEDWKDVYHGYALMPRVVAAAGETLYFTTLDAVSSSAEEATAPQQLRYSLWKMQASEKAVEEIFISEPSELPRDVMTEHSEHIPSPLAGKSLQPNPAYVTGGVVKTISELLEGYPQSSAHGVGPHKSAATSVAFTSATSRMPLIDPLLPVDPVDGKLYFMEKEIPSFAALFEAGSFDLDRLIQPSITTLSHFTRLGDNLGIYLRWSLLPERRHAIELWSVAYVPLDAKIVSNRLKVLHSEEFTFENCRVSTFLVPGKKLAGGDGSVSVSNDRLYISFTEFDEKGHSPLRYSLWETAGTMDSTRFINVPKSSAVDMGDGDEANSYQLKMHEVVGRCFDIVGDGHSRQTNYLNDEERFVAPNLSPVLADRWWGGVVGTAQKGGLLILCPALTHIVELEVEEDSSEVKDIEGTPVAPEIAAVGPTHWPHDETGGAYHIWSLQRDESADEDLFTRVYPPHPNTDDSEEVKLIKTGSYVWITYPFTSHTDEDMAGTAANHHAEPRYGKLGKGLLTMDGVRYSRGVAYFVAPSMKTVGKVDTPDHLRLVLWRTDGTVDGTIEFHFAADSNIADTTDPFLGGERQSFYCRTMLRRDIWGTKPKFTRPPSPEEEEDCQNALVGTEILPLAAGGVAFRLYRRTTRYEINLHQRTFWYVTRVPNNINRPKSSELLLQCLPHDHKLHECVSIGHRLGGTSPFLLYPANKEIHMESGDLYGGGLSEFPEAFRDFSISFIACRFDGAATEKDADEVYSKERLDGAVDLGRALLFAFPNTGKPTLIMAGASFKPSVRTITGHPSLNLQSFMPLYKDTIIFFSNTGDLYSSDGSDYGTRLIHEFKSITHAPTHFFDSWAGTLNPVSRVPQVLFFLQSVEEEKEAYAGAPVANKPVAIEGRVFARMSHRSCDLYSTNGSMNSVTRVLEAFPCRCVPPLALSERSEGDQQRIKAKLLQSCPDLVSTPKGTTRNFIFVTDDSPSCVGSDHTLEEGCIQRKSRRGWVHSLWMSDGSLAGSRPLLTAPPVCPQRVAVIRRTEGHVGKTFIVWQSIDLGVDADTVARPYISSSSPNLAISHYKIYVRTLTVQDSAHGDGYTGALLTNSLDSDSPYVLKTVVSSSAVSLDPDDKTLTSYDISSSISDSDDKLLKYKQLIAVKVVAANDGGESLSAVEATTIDSTGEITEPIINFYSCPEVMGTTQKSKSEGPWSALDVSVDTSTAAPMSPSLESLGQELLEIQTKLKNLKLDIVQRNDLLSRESAIKDQIVDIKNSLAADEEDSRNNQELEKLKESERIDNKKRAENEKEEIEKVEERQRIQREIVKKREEEELQKQKEFKEREELVRQHLRERDEMGQSAAAEIDAALIGILVFAVVIGVIALAIWCQYRSGLSWSMIYHRLRLWFSSRAGDGRVLYSQVELSGHDNATAIHFDDDEDYAVVGGVYEYGGPAGGHLDDPRRDGLGRRSGSCDDQE